jgi:hypothetical protein
MIMTDVALDKKSDKSSSKKMSWDTWAVLAAFVAALLIRFGVVKHIPW